MIEPRTLPGFMELLPKHVSFEQMKQKIKNIIKKILVSTIRYTYSGRKLSEILLGKSREE